LAPSRVNAGDNRTLHPTRSGDSVAAMLKAGDKAPAFTLLDQDGNTVKLSDFKGRKVLVYFYPKADTPGCTQQACGLRDVMPKVGDTVVLGISPDKPAKQKKFDDKYSLGFPLLADEDHAVAEAFDVWTEKSMYGRKYMGILRSAFLIDEKGKIAEAWYKISPKDTATNLLSSLAG
jgi:peroxiredoxin Q/BCP